MDKDLFGLYYINLDKVYELKTIINNFELQSRIIEKNKSYNEKHEMAFNTFGNLKDILGSSVSTTSAIENLNSLKVSDAFSVKQTKSSILHEILKLATERNNLDDVKCGDLIILRNISFVLVNEDLVRVIKMLSQNIIKEQIANGININKTLNALTKDYSYLLSSSDKNIIIKIPISAENEFESKYSIDDLILGKVNIVGVYKGKIKGRELKNTFEFFKNLGEVGDKINYRDDEIQNSSYENLISGISLKTSLKEEAEYDFIDLFAITQNINITIPVIKNKLKWYQKLFRRRCKNGSKNN